MRPRAHGGRQRVWTGKQLLRITARPDGPRTPLLGRYDATGRLAYVGRTTTLARAAGVAVASLLTNAGAGAQLPQQALRMWR